MYFILRYYVEGIVNLNRLYKIMLNFPLVTRICLEMELDFIENSINNFFKKNGKKFREEYEEIFREEYSDEFSDEFAKEFGKEFGKEVDIVAKMIK